ncbi:MAG: hypothetical protein J6P99_05615 [Paludibacteraceae bacterium]|nr:hypothetical protein [Paludibacteraceae bacterium]
MGISRVGQVVVWGESGGSCLNRAFGVTEVTPPVKGKDGYVQMSLHSVAVGNYMFHR